MTKYQDEFKKLYDTYDNLLEYKHHLSLSDDFISYFDRERSWLKRLESPEFFVAFVGVFSAGKSVIVNALLENDILPEDINPLTAAPTIIRKSKDGQTKVIVNYINENEKKELQILYIENILKEMNKSNEISQFTDKDIYISIDLLKKIDKQREYSNSVINYEGIELLRDNWSKFKQDNEIISVERLKEYIAEKDINNNKNIRPTFIRTVEIYLHDTDIGEDIVLVDLPGIGVSNPLHIKATKNYIENEAKAFVFATKAMTGIGDDDNLKLITDINQSRPDVIQNAFWVFNQWDLLGEEQRRSSLKGFIKECNDRNIKFSDERLYKVSALLYLMIKYFEKGILQSSDIYKTRHSDIFDKNIGLLNKVDDVKDKIEKIEYLKDFKRFKKDLFEYLSTKGRYDFEESAKNKLLELSKELLKKIEGKYEHVESSEQIEENLLSNKVVEEFNSYVRNLERLIKNSIADTKQEVENKIFWDTSSQDDLINKIREKIRKIDTDEIRKDMIDGSITSMDHKLPFLIGEKINAYKLIENKFISFFNESFSTPFIKSLKEQLNTNLKYMPQDLKDYIDSQIDIQIIQNRLRGISDILLMDFDNQLNFLLKNSSNTNNNKDINIELKTPQLFGSFGGGTTKIEIKKSFDNNNVEAAIQIVEDGICEYIRELEKNANSYIKVSIQRYLVSVGENIEKKLKDEEANIRNKIRNSLKQEIKNSVAPEIRRFKIYNESIQTLKKNIFSSSDN